MPKVINDENVYRSTIKVLSSFGYERATTKKIALAAGIHEATLFRKYGNKFNLIEQAIKAKFQNVPLADLKYTGNLQDDLCSIVEAYLKTSEMVGNILPIIFIDMSRNPELTKLFAIPWGNITRINKILEKYQVKKMIRIEPILSTTNALLGPLMTSHFLGTLIRNFKYLQLTPKTMLIIF